MSESNSREILDRRKAALAAAIRQQFHPELRTAVFSDKGSVELAEAINDLIELHCLKVKMELA